MESELRRAYAVLGLSPPVGEEALKHQYRELTKRWHPDRYAADPVGQSEATRRMAEISRAYRIVSATLNASASAEELSGSHDGDASGLSRQSVEGIIASINSLASWSLRPRMSRSRWLSLLTLVAYFVVASAIIPVDLSANRDIARAVAQASGYFVLPLFLIWMADAQESRTSRVVFGTIGWIFMLAPALLGVVIWAWP